MKKIHLSIPRPCHEDWDAMTPSDKGRFCDSCQKTVIDFTNMSDPQLVAFFKTPPASVCGRVHSDQLNREIVIPKKRIPWVKYFFQFTWPAFVLFLKSCGVKENVKGKVKVESRAADVQEHSIATVGMMIPEITPVDTSVIKEEIVKQGEIMGDTILVDTIDSVAMPVDSSIEEPEIIYKPMDTVVIQSNGMTTGKMMLSGAISVCRTRNIQQEKDSLQDKTKFKKEIKFKAYPNPVHAGSLLNISFEHSNDFPKRIQILSSSGQLISQLQKTRKEYAPVTNIQIPSNAAAGIYFLQMLTNNNELKTAKIIVTK